MTSYTPGPWKMWANGDALPGTFSIGAVNGTGRFALSDGAGPYFNEANARLIAAAPDLYEAAMLALRIVGKHGLNRASTSYEDDRLVTDALLAALQKARGEQVPA